MDWLAGGVALFATALLLGAMAFFSAVVAPLVFVTLDAATAGRFIRQLFPWYYLAVIVLAVAAAAALAAVRPWDGVAMAAVAAAGVLARQGLMPRINRDRDRSLEGDAAAGARFARLHRLSVWINAAQIVVAAVVLARFVGPA